MAGSRNWRSSCPAPAAWRWVALVWLGLVVARPAAADPSARPSDLSDFHGAFQAPMDTRASTARSALGLVTVPDAPESEEAVRGAALAVAVANAEGGLRGDPFTLEIAEARGSWATAAEAGRDLRYDRECLGIITPTAGSVAHLLAQVAIRGRVPVLSLSSEGSLTRIPDPWLFRVVPDSRAVIRRLIDRLPADTPATTIPTIVPEARPGRTLREDLSAVTAATGARLEPVSIDRLLGADDLLPFRDHSFLMVLLPIDATEKTLRRLHEGGWRGTVFSGAAVTPEAASSWPGIDVVTAPAFHPDEPRSSVRRFVREYRHRHGEEPGPIAASAYDAASVMIAAARAVGRDRSAIRNWMTESGELDTVTGFTGFDGSGNRNGLPTEQHDPRSGGSPARTNQASAPTPGESLE